MLRDIGRRKLSWHKQLRLVILCCPRFHLSVILLCPLLHLLVLLVMCLLVVFCCLLLLIVVFCLLFWFVFHLLLLVMIFYLLFLIIFCLLLLVGVFYQLFLVVVLCPLYFLLTSNYYSSLVLRLIRIISFCSPHRFFIFFCPPCLLRFFITQFYLLKNDYFIKYLQLKDLLPQYDNKNNII